MTLQNRVSPDGRLIATPARGELMGNRGGRIHDPGTRTLTKRRWTSSRWICCVLSFKDRHREVWGRSYTELFFLDDVTALAAGHRPCYECRRRDAVAFAAAVALSLGLASPPTASELDRRLHVERLDGREKRLHDVELSELPDGAMVLYEEEAWAVAGHELLRWSPGGYAKAIQRPGRGAVQAFTPPTAVLALAGGFRPSWHSSTQRPVPAS